MASRSELPAPPWRSAERAIQYSRLLGLERDEVEAITEQAHLTELAALVQLAETPPVVPWVSLIRSSVTGNVSAVLTTRFGDFYRPEHSREEVESYDCYFLDLSYQQVLVDRDAVEDRRFALRS